MTIKQFWNWHCYLLVIQQRTENFSSWAYTEEIKKTTKQSDVVITDIWHNSKLQQLSISNSNANSYAIQYNELF